MSNKLSIAFADLKTRGTKVTHANSTFLCYADATVSITAGDVEVLELRIRNFQLKVVNGKFRVEFPTEKHDGKYIPTVFPKTAVSRNRLTRAMLRAYEAHVNAQSAAA